MSNNCSCSQQPSKPGLNVDDACQQPRISFSQMIEDVLKVGVVVILPGVISIAAAVVVLRRNVPPKLVLQADTATGAMPALGISHYIKAFLSPLKVLRGIGSPVSHKNGKSSFNIPDLCVTVEGFKPSSGVADEIEKVVHGSAATVCTSQGNIVPFTYFDTVSQPLMIRLMTHPQFPLALLGSVKCRVSIHQIKATKAGAAVDMSAKIETSRPHRRGTEVDFLVTVIDRDSAEVVWKARTTILFFHRSDSMSSAEPSGLPDREFDSDTALPLTADLGRRFATVTGDYNPIHMYSWSAKLFGFRSCIVHGMCLAAMALPILLKETQRTKAHTTPEKFNPAKAALPNLEGKLRFEVTFRRPVFLPSTQHLLVWSLGKEVVFGIGTARETAAQVGRLVLG